MDTDARNIPTSAIQLITGLTVKYPGAISIRRHPCWGKRYERALQRLAIVVSLRGDCHENWRGAH